MGVPAALPVVDAPGVPVMPALNQKELNRQWLIFAAIIEKHGKENNSPEWRGPKRTLHAMQHPAPVPQYERGDLP